MTKDKREMLRLSEVPAIVQEQHGLARDSQHLELRAQVLDSNQVTLYIQRRLCPPLGVRGRARSPRRSAARGRW